MSEETDDAAGREVVYNALKTRRRFMAGAAAITTTALAGCGGSDDGGEGNGTQTTTEGSPMDEATPTETEESGGNQTNPDVDVLNYALTLEHLEHAFYRDGLESFSDEELKNAEPVSNFGDEVREKVPQRIATIRDHEKGHVDTITSVVEDLGGEPVGEAEYTFEYEAAADFLATAKVLENTGVAAYKGAAPAIKQNKILSSALGIHSVEARHAGFLNALNLETPFPNPYDQPKSPMEVKEAANPFFQDDITQSETNLNGQNEPEAERKAEDDTSDVDVLNFALTLEHLEHAFYRDGLESFSDDEIRDADVLSKFGDEIRSSVPERLKSVRDHESSHVDTITSTIEDLGEQPVEEAEYTFEYNSASEFIGTAKVLENTGVSAYAGAAPTVANDDVFVAAATIHSVEARHAGYLNELNGESAYPNAVDEAKSIQEVKEAVQPFIENSE
jgi:rubrerythrin